MPLIVRPIQTLDSVNFIKKFITIIHHIIIFLARKIIIGVPYFHLMYSVLRQEEIQKNMNIELIAIYHKRMTDHSQVSYVDF